VEAGGVDVDAAEEIKERAGALRERIAARLLGGGGEKME